MSPHLDDEAPSLSPESRPGPVELTVASLDRLIPFYRDYLGMRLHERQGRRAALGAGGEDLVRLVEEPEGQRPQGTAGLYHFAVLLPERRDLARLIARLITRSYPNYPTDHIMTETTYLSDPEGNGVEVYVDTPEDGYFGFADGAFVARDAGGNARSGRDALDLDELFRNLDPSDPLDEPMPSTTRIGHVHLHVRNLPDAYAFYHRLIGFDDMGYAPAFGAAFLSAGGYHHHLGLNVWLGEGIPPAPPGALGLRHFTMILPSAAEVTAIGDRLESAGRPAAATEGGLLARDPSGIGILLRSTNV
jgi:catechol 2,3-dioxygenase